jgi:retinol dehydrogenase-12
MKEKICLITGATDGIGKATARKLVDQGYRLVIVGRNREKVASFVREIANTGKGINPDYIIADLSSLEEVNRMVEIFKERYDRLDVLINNAGVVMPVGKATVDGFETTFQVNYLAPFIITNSLLGHLKKSANGRIVNVTSNIYAMGKFDARGMYVEARYSAIGAYAASKLYLLMFTEELARRVGEGVTVNCLHPGIVKTNMATQVRDFPLIFKVISFIALPFAITPEKGAETTTLLATSDTVRNVTGKYFANSRQAKTKNKFDTPQNRKVLWDISTELWTNSRLKQELRRV